MAVENGVWTMYGMDWDEYSQSQRTMETAGENLDS